MSDPVVSRRSIHVRRDGWQFESEWLEITNIHKVFAGGVGNYLYKVDGIEYHSRSPEWREKLSELKIWGKLQNV